MAEVSPVNGGMDVTDGKLTLWPLGDLIEILDK